MVENTATLLKKPLFKDRKKFFQSILKSHHHQDMRDGQGNTIAHLCILYGSHEYLSKVSYQLDIKNKAGLTPRDFLQLLDVSHDPLIQATHQHPQMLCVHKTQEGILADLSPEESKKHFHMDYLDHLVFKKGDDLLWTIKRCQKKLADPAIKRKNHWIDSLYGNAFFSKKLPLTYIRWINPLIGYGLFAGEDIPQYSLIGEYTGVIRKRKYRLDKYNDYIFGYVTADSGTSFVIDAQQYGNHTRFINHSDEPNLYSTWLIVHHICHVILVTKQAIAKDMQLTYDYGPTYWKKRSDPLMI